MLLCHAGSVLSAGLLLLLFHWKPSLEVQAKCEPCALGQADWVIIRVSPMGPRPAFPGWGSGGLGWGSVDPGLDSVGLALASVELRLDSMD